MNIKWGYWIVIMILVFVGVVSCFWIHDLPKKKPSNIGNVVQVVGTLAVLITVIVALAIADPPRKKVKAEVKAHISSAEIHKYPKDELSELLKRVYQDHPNPFTSRKVEFEITNTSDFDWVKPVLTFRLPLKKLHPKDKKEGQRHYTELTFNSNMFSSQRELHWLEFGDTGVLSNSNLLYWNRNNQQPITIWIRMVLDEGKKLEPFKVEVSVNCEGTDGWTDEVEIFPSNLPTEEKSELLTTTLGASAPDHSLH